MIQPIHPTNLNNKTVHVHTHPHSQTVHTHVNKEEDIMPDLESMPVDNFIDNVGKQLMRIINDHLDNAKKVMYSLK